MDPLVFKKWKNRGWSVFASLHRVIIIATLSFSYQMLGQETGGAKTDSTHIPRMELEEVETIASWPAGLEEAILKPLVLMGAPELEAAPAAGTQEEILETLPDIDIRQRGKQGTQADLSIRGGSFDQGMVLLNGINLSDPQTGHFALNLPLDLQATNGMEVMTGSATRSLGIHAFSGAVNLLSSPSDTSGVRAGMQGGQYGLYRANILVNLAGTSIQRLISAGTSGSRGYRPNTDFRNHHAYLHLRSRAGAWKGHLMLGMNSRRFGANAFYSPRFPGQYEETGTGLAALKMIRQAGRDRWDLKLYTRLNRDHFLLDRNDPSFYSNDHLSHAGGAELSYRHSWTAGVSQTSVSYRNESIRSTSIGEELDQARTAFLDDSLVYTHGTGRNILGWNLNHSWQAGPLRLSGGFLLSTMLSSPQNTGLYPGLDIRLALPRELFVFASVNRSLRLPTFTDLYYQGPSNRGNPLLRPEKAMTLEAGIYRNHASLYMELQGWYRLGRELIDWVWLEDELWHTMNYSRVNAMGSSLLLQYRPVQAGNAAVQIHSASLGYALGHQLKQEDEYTSRYLLDYLKHKVVLSGRISFGQCLGMSVQGLFQDRSGSFLAFDASDGTSTEKEYPPFFILDLKLDLRVWRMVFFAEASNVFNKEYYDIGNIMQPGRWISLGVKVH